MRLFRVITVAACALACITLQLARAADSLLPTGMTLIPAGRYEPAFRQPNEAKEVSINSFLLDTTPVSNAEFLEFVRARPEWRRSQVKRLFADEQYLAHWAADLELGSTAKTNQPVTRVSWFAARAYARWKGKRLPTTSEWEYAGQASETEPNGMKNR